jgi:hypothetical protein
MGISSDPQNQHFVERAYCDGVNQMQVDKKQNLDMFKNGISGKVSCEPINRVQTEKSKLELQGTCLDPTTRFQREQLPQCRPQW